MRARTDLHIERHYIGRFAPSPTGPLHFGSLLTAVASYLDCKARGGIWLLRIEDLDPPREQAGAAADIMLSLRQHGMIWDHPPLWQHRRHHAYEQALAELQLQGRLFPCQCSRAQLAASGGKHRGRCTSATTPPSPSALRFRVDDTVVGFDDRLQGSQRQNLWTDSGDFVLKRKDGLYAYQLAVIVDDEFQGVTDVVRGCDLLNSTARQIALQTALRMPHPRYLHLPLLVDASGQKLSKQTNAPALDPAAAGANLRRVLALLGQPQPPAAAVEPRAILAAAAEHWSPERLPAVDRLPVPDRH